MRLQAVTNTVHNLRVGDVVEVKSGKSTTERVKLTSKPEFNPYWQRWYAWGSRFIKSRGKFSGTVALHNFRTADLVAYWPTL